MRHHIQLTARREVVSASHKESDCSGRSSFVVRRSLFSQSLVIADESPTESVRLCATAEATGTQRVFMHRDVSLAHAADEPALAGRPGRSKSVEVNKSFGSVYSVDGWSSV